MRYDMFKIAAFRNVSLRQPCRAIRHYRNLCVPCSCSLFLFPVPTRHRGNKLFPVPVPSRKIHRCKCLWGARILFFGQLHPQILVVFRLFGRGCLFWFSFITLGLKEPSGGLNWCFPYLYCELLALKTWCNQRVVDRVVPNFALNNAVPPWIWTKLFRHGDAKVVQRKR